MNVLPRMTKGFFLFSFLAFFPPFPSSTSSLFNKVENFHKGPYEHVLLDFKSDLKVPLSSSV